MTFNLPLSSTVQHALAHHHPVVVLESTLMTHGLPRLINLEVARQLEQAVIDNSATPETIAILNGEIHVGLEPHEIVNSEAHRYAVSRQLDFRRSVIHVILWSLSNKAFTPRLDHPRSNDTPDDIGSAWSAGERIFTRNTFLQ